MAENENPEVEPVAVKKGLPIKVIAIGVMSLLVISGVGFVGARYFLSQDEAAVEKPKVNKKNSPSEKEMGYIHRLDTFIVNLNDKKSTKYLKLTVNLELAQEEIKTELEKKSPIIKDALIILFSSKTSEDVMTTDGKFILRDEIISKMNKIIGKDMITNAYFSDFVIQ